jgi:hypothetical protein
MDGGESDGGRGVTRRAVLLSLALVALIAPAAFLGEMVFGTTYMFGSGVPAMAPLALLFIAAAVNPLLKRAGLSRGELLSVYGVVLVGAPLVTHGILIWCLSSQAYMHYGARSTPEWERIFLNQIPVWFSPSDTDVIESYFQGATAVPWAAWRTPALAWSSFLLALFLCTLFLVLLVRRQWITHERLSFPIAQVPLELIREQGKAAGLPQGWPFWIGFLVSFGILSLSRLSGLFPAVPDISLTGQILMQWQSTGPLAGLGAWELWLPPSMIAIAYLIPKDLSFSCWFFWLVRIALTVAAIAAGATPQRPEEWWSSTFPAAIYQGGGAVLAVAAWALWIARRHLGRAARLALSRPGAGDDAGEPLAYRWVFLGLVVTFGYLVWFCWAAGCRVIVAGAIILLIVAYYLVWARLRAETGLGFIPFPLTVNSMIVVPFGSAVFHTREIITLFSLRWSYFPGFGESYEVCTGSSLEAFKVAESGRLRSRPLLAAIVAGFVISLAVGVVVVLIGEYHYGFLRTRAAWSGWLTGQMRLNGSQILTTLTTPSRSDTNGVIAMAAGAVVTIVLGLLRLRFWWWPFHPIGYLAANCWGMHWFSQAFFAGWVCKFLVIRYGGLALFRRTVPLAIGLIAGDFMSEAAWVLVMSVLRAYGVAG